VVSSYMFITVSYTAIVEVTNGRKGLGCNHSAKHVTMQDKFFCAIKQVTTVIQRFLCHHVDKYCEVNFTVT
jgi:hypothetical protein